MSNAVFNQFFLFSSHIQYLASFHFFSHLALSSSVAGFQQSEHWQ
jgi:hypothetical protein